MATCPAAGRLENGSCSGMGCCQAAIPRGINTYEVQFDDRFTTSRTRGFSRCSYAALVEAAAFDFRTTYVTADDFMESTGGKVPLVLDWVVGKETCREAARNTTAYMCVSSNSECVDSRNGPGYLCNCSRGYGGNPYIHDGCRGVFFNSLEFLKAGLHRLFFILNCYLLMRTLRCSVARFTYLEILNFWSPALESCLFCTSIIVGDSEF
jgi:hypothetical protein